MVSTTLSVQKLFARGVEVNVSERKTVMKLVMYGLRGREAIELHIRLSVETTL